MKSTNQTTKANQFVKLFLALTLTISFAQGAFAQKIKIGPRLSVSTSDIEPGDLLDSDGNSPDQLSILLKEATPEYGVGGFLRIQILGIYVQPEILVSTSKVVYQENNSQLGNGADRKERFYNMAIPVMAGTKLGPIRAQAGPVFRRQINSFSELVDVSGYGRNSEESSIGVRAGVGVDLGDKIILDLTYEANLKGFVNEVTIGSSTYQLSNRKPQLSLSLGLAL